MKTQHKYTLEFTWKCDAEPWFGRSLGATVRLFDTKEEAEHYIRTLRTYKDPDGVEHQCYVDTYTLSWVTSVTKYHRIRAFRSKYERPFVQALEEVIDI